MAKEHYFLALFDVEVYVVEEYCTIIVNSLQALNLKNLVARLALHLEDDTRILAA